MRHETLLSKVMACGLVQFGIFGDTPDDKDLLLEFELLASYPDLLRELATALVASVKEVRFDRILCSVDSLPLGVMVGQLAGVPLVYMQNRFDSPVKDFVGAYDIAHPTLVIANVLDKSFDVRSLIRKCGAVGLEPQTIASVLSFLPANSLEDIAQFSLWQWGDFLWDVQAAGLITTSYAEYLQKRPL